MQARAPATSIPPTTRACAHTFLPSPTTRHSAASQLWPSSSSSVLSSPGYRCSTSTGHWHVASLFWFFYATLAQALTSYRTRGGPLPKSNDGGEEDGRGMRKRNVVKPGRASGSGRSVGGQGWLGGEWVGYDSVRGGQTWASEEMTGVDESRGGGMASGCRRVSSGVESVC